MVVRGGERIETGAGAGLRLRLDEGSAVKLGERARLEVPSIAAAPEPSGLFRATLNVLRGAFRFTTQLVTASRAREVTARVGTATIGIRGTDVWGKSAEDLDFVVLIEGTITVEREGLAVSMSDPGTLYRAPRGRAAEPLSAVDPNDLARFAQETELRPGGATLAAEGRFRLVLASFLEPASAEELAARLGEAGYPAATEPVTVRGRSFRRVQIEGLATAADAGRMLEQLAAADFRFRTPWVDAG
jgi:hypothetical protein